ncbi:hypothetical protein BXO88_10785 [Oribacterium sp. C9]|uniref:replication initiation protein n=1 Tax=Oribacterium sp. C9 TaxID=1943579 RepID=UPI0009902993|nr:replication initiation protein [Oribacterium sp. C9]OON85737.1 hypothetical protein BXO88_10785 [Oribacterium sp. C9]
MEFERPSNRKKKIVGKPVKVDDPRNYTIRKMSELIQEGRFNLDKNQFKALSFIISFIKLTDDINTVYSFDCRKFLNSLGYRPDCNLSEARNIVQSLARQRWWMRDKSTGNWKLAGWIDLAETDSDTRIMHLTFHKTVARYIFDLDNKLPNQYITRYKYGSISQMQKEYSPRLYELLKSYSNNSEWTFEYNTDSEKDLRVILAKTEENEKTHKRVVIIPKNWGKYSLFKRDVLEPAKEEINKYSDLHIDYEPLRVDLSGVTHRGTAAIKFYISQSKVNQNEEARFVEEPTIVDEPEQLSFADAFPELNHKQMDEFAKAKEEALNNSKYPCTLDILYGSVTEAQVVALVDMLKEKLTPNRISENNMDAWACDVIGHYWRKINATPDKTKSTPFFRLMSDLNYDNDQIINRKSMWENQ